MAINVPLYNELYNLRQHIKRRERQSYGRTPTVCTDSALYEIAELCPKKLSDFEGISGIGKAFIENYGDEFLAVILKYTVGKTDKKMSMNASAADTLKELEKKLVSINKRNRLLYMPKMSNRYAFDMYEAGAGNLLSLIYGKTPSITLASLENLDEIEYQKQIVKFKQVSQLLREINKDLRDKGQNDLYIGYPFVIGKIPGEDFSVRAPLALFPVKADKTPTSIKIMLDDTRDVVYNTTLILAYFKFNNISEPLPNEVVEGVVENSFLSDLLKFYEDNKIYIKDKGSEFSRFCEYKADEFPSFRNGELYLEKTAILGKFPTCSSSIQKDFDEILKNNEINSLLNDLLLNSEEIDYYADLDDDGEIDDENLSISENKLVYINELNSSQEAVLSAIDKCDELVVQGPPGTGKSQVITSLISKFVSGGKTVLMVSEKKTALDVVYSRLGNLSQYALLIDDVGNKEAFYKQLSKMVNLGCTTKDKVDLSPVSNQIDELIKRLKAIADELYAVNDFGIEPYKLYIQNKRYDLSVNEQRNIVNVIHKYRNEHLLNIEYSELERVHKTFEDATLCANLEKYIKIVRNFPWMYALRGDISEYETIVLTDKLTEIAKEIDNWKGKNFFAKAFTKGKINKAIKQVLTEYFNEVNKDMVKLVFEKIAFVIESIVHYIGYQELKPLYERLTQTEKTYISSLLKIKQYVNDDYTAINNELYNELIFEHIDSFESQNRMLFKDIDNFDAIIRSLSEAIATKQKLSRKRLEAILAEGMYNIKASKRQGEILRALESKRKWSVNKFIRKFDFELFKSVKIWLLTPEVVSEIIPLQTGIFDLVVFDEASQMYVEKGVPSILRAKKVIIAGDHKQLRPSSLGVGRTEIDLDELGEDEEISAALEEESLLDLARFKYKDVMLNFHYRSKYEELIAFSNHAFYKGKLYVSPNAEPPEIPPIEVHKMKTALWQNRTNLAEATYIVEMLKKFFKTRKDETVGIITFNSSQRDLIDDLIDEECAKDPDFAASIRTELVRKKDGEDIGLFVKNIESVQGDERDVIIFSIGYAKNENGCLIRNFGWLNQKGGENRLNVAISRAKKKVHIVTSFEPSELRVEDTKNDGPRILKKYLEYAFAVSNGDKVAAKQILHSFGDSENASQNASFDSDFLRQVYNALTVAGYEVDTQVGIGGYSIDLAIKKDGKYLLGIECDGKLYHSSKSARERDYHRQKYLESRGWSIHRIWSTNWWKNPHREISKIATIVNSL